MTYLDYLRNQQLRKKKKQKDDENKNNSTPISDEIKESDENKTKPDDESESISFTDDNINDDIESDATIIDDESNDIHKENDSYETDNTQGDSDSEEKPEKNSENQDVITDVKDNSSEIHPIESSESDSNDTDSANDSTGNHPITDDNPVPLNTALVIVDVQNGFMNENTDYIPGAINDFIHDNKEWFSEIIRMKLTGGDINVYPNDRSGKAGPARTLRNSFQSRFTSPINKLHGEIIKHKNSTDVSELIDYINSHNIQHVYICGLETDVILYPMISCLRNANIDVSVIYDLTATAIGAYIQLALKPALEHLLGKEHVIEASIPDTTPMEKSDERIKKSNADSI